MFAVELDELMLQTGIDIPFWQGRLTIHQPSIKEIAFVTEENFWTGFQMLNFKKDLFFSEEDKDRLEMVTDFDVFMSIMNDTKNASFRKYQVCAKMVLVLLFPDYQIDYQREKIVFQKDEQQGFIDKNNYDVFKAILSRMVSPDSDKNKEYNPAGELSQKIANKLKQAQLRRAQLKGDKNEKSTILSRYVSILAIGKQCDVNEICSYTIYQLLDEFQRYMLKQQYDVYIQAQLAGATGLEDVDDWTKDLHP